MVNQKAVEYWSKMATNNPTETTIKVNKVNDFTHIDADFILRYSNISSRILDLASGTGLTINKIHSSVAHITAIEVFEEFSKFISKTEKINVVNKNILSFDTVEKFDLVTMFGIVSYFNEEEIINVYSKYINFLSPNGKIIIKNQFGVKEDVLVDGFSNELKTYYFSHYRHLEKEIKILNNLGLINIEVIDIYPPECNRWENTHFYAIVAQKE
jgi:predicted TPR repeat methyltransferase